MTYDVARPDFSLYGQLEATARALAPERPPVVGDRSPAERLENFLNYAGHIGRTLRAADMGIIDDDERDLYFSSMAAALSMSTHYVMPHHGNLERGIEEGEVDARSILLGASLALEAVVQHYQSSKEDLLKKQEEKEKRRGLREMIFEAMREGGSPVFRRGIIDDLARDVDEEFRDMARGTLDKAFQDLLEDGAFEIETEMDGPPHLPSVGFRLKPDYELPEDE